MFIRLRYNKKIGSIWFIPILVLPQKNLKSNNLLFENFELFFDSINVTYSKKVVNGVRILTVEGHKNIFDILLPFFHEAAPFFYWKSTHYKVISNCGVIISSGLHFTILGLKLLIREAYNYQHNREHSLAFWISKTDEYFKIRDKKCLSHHHFIIPVKGVNDLANVQIGWCVILPYRLAD